MLHFGLVTTQVITSILIFYAPNPMRAILLMILLFVEAAIGLALFSLDFFALLFILIYVGAVAVLFLFVVMLLQIKSKNINIKLSFTLNVALSFGLIIAYQTWLRGKISSSIFFKETIEVSSSLEYLSDLSIMGQMMYNNYLGCFLIVGYILLIALVGAITLLYDYNALKASPDMHKALSKNPDSTYCTQN